MKNINVRVSLQCEEVLKPDIEWHETFEYKFWLDASVYNNKQHWNKDKCSCECEELIEKGVCDAAFIWTPSNFECENDKLSDIGNAWTMKIVNVERKY